MRSCAIMNHSRNNLESTDEWEAKGPPIGIGPTRRLNESVLNLLERLNLSQKGNNRNGRKLVILAEVLLICGFALRILSMYFNEQLDHFNIWNSTLWAEELRGIGMVDKMKHREASKALHMTIMSFVFFLVVPQLYLLTVMANETVTLVLQSVLAILIMGLTVGFNVYTLMVVQVECSSTLCVHKNTAILLNLVIFVLMTIILVRMLLQLRFRKWILNIKVVGPFIHFLVSRRSKDFQVLLLMIFQIVTITSGMITNSTQFVDAALEKGPAAIENKILYLILFDLLSALPCLGGMLVLILIYFHDHAEFSHSQLVSEVELDQELGFLGKRHSDVLLKDNLVSKTRYRPVTRLPYAPVSSGQLIVPKTVEKRETKTNM